MACVSTTEFKSSPLVETQAVETKGQNQTAVLFNTCGFDTSRECHAGHSTTEVDWNWSFM